MEDLSREQIEELKHDLELLLQEIRNLLSASSDSSRPVELDQPIGRLSRMDAMQQQHMAKANRQAHEQRLLQVESALKMIARSDYGLCRRCEEPIGYARLKARPEAPFCLTCQGAREGGR